MKTKTLFIAALAAVVLIALCAMGLLPVELAAALPLLGMAALTADRNTPLRSGDEIVLPAAAAKKFFAGALVARDASGNATPGAVATTILGVGVAAEYADNSGGSAGDLTVRIKKGIFRFANSTGGDLIAAADIGNNCYIVDDQTVAKTDGTGTRSVAGKVFDVDSDGVWVRFD